MSCECELVTDFLRLQEVSADWQRWASPAGHANIFQSWAWAQAFWKAHCDEVRLHSILVRDQEKLLGILPLVLRGNTLEFFGSPESDSNDVLCEDRDAVRVLGAALAALLKNQGSWNAGVLNHVPAESRIVRSIPELPWSLRRHLQLVFRCPSPTILVQEAGEHSRTLDSLLMRKSSCRI